MSYRDRIVELRRVRASDLLPNPKNWRTHPTGQRSALSDLLADIGIADAVLAREVSGGRLMLIDGHLRADILGSSTVPVLVLDVTEAEADLILATHDPVAAMAGSDASKVDALLATIKTESTPIAALLASLQAAKSDEPMPTPRSHKSTSEESYADPETEFREPGKVIQYTLIFDDESQQDAWFSFVRWLKKSVDGETIGGRLANYIEGLEIAE